MAVIERNICVITALNCRGVGISKLDSEPIELPYTIPDEIIEFEKHIYRNKLSYTISKILDKSENRISPPCQYFTICGGCSLQHLDVDYYNKIKLDNLQQTLATYSVVVGTISPIKFIGANNRRRAVFEAIKKRDLLFLGFKKFRSNQIVNIDNCLLLTTELSNLIPQLKNILKKFLIDKEKCKVLVTQADNGIDLVIEITNNNIITPELTEILQDFAINNHIIKLTVINNIKWNLIYLSENPYVLFDNVAVAIDNHCFLQVSKSSDIILTNLINNCFDKIKTTKPLQIADLFCGRGTLTIPASKFGVIDGFETENTSVKALTKAVKNTTLKASIYQRDLFTKPLEWDELNKYDVVIINPPRAGTKEQANLLSKNTVRTIIYLSCNLESFARDAKLILHNNRYQLKEITPLDQFYWSHHIELLAIFELV
ncbi:MAG: class I SAM-dependent RNA methyltransferase [Rickettsiaceae bacterium]